MLIKCAQKFKLPHTTLLLFHMRSFLTLFCALDVYEGAVTNLWGLCLIQTVGLLNV